MLICLWVRGIPWEGDEVSVFSGVYNNIKWRNLEKKEDRENARVMTPILHYLSLFVRIQNIGVHPDALEWLRTKNQRTQVDGMVQSSAAISGTVTIFFLSNYIQFIYRLHSNFPTIISMLRNCKNVLNLQS